MTTLLWLQDKTKYIKPKIKEKVETQLDSEVEITVGDVKLPKRQIK